MEKEAPHQSQADAGSLTEKEGGPLDRGLVDATNLGLYRTTLMGASVRSLIPGQMVFHYSLIVGRRLMESD
jgi:hypothetical protein